MNGQAVREISQILDRVRGYPIIDWKYLPSDEDARETAFKALQNLVEKLT